MHIYIYTHTKYVYYKQLYTHKCDNLDGIDQFLERLSLPKVT